MDSSVQPPDQRCPAQGRAPFRALLPVLLATLFAVSGGPLQGRPRPQEKSGAREAKGAGKETVPPAAGLLEVVKIEARKEREARDRRLREDILKLGIYTDPDLEFVQRKRREILDAGPAAVPLLLEAMERVSGERTRINAGRVAADLLARIDDPAVEDRVKEALARLLDSKYDLVRANAVRCIGEKGLTAFLDRVKENLKSRDVDLLSETLRCVARLGAEDTPALAAPFLKHPDPGVRTAALKALILHGRPGKALPLRATEVLARAVEIPVQNAALDFLERFGNDPCIPPLVELYRSHRLRRKEALRLLGVIAAVAVRSTDPEVREGVKAFIKTLLDEGDFETVRKAARYLFDLGDGSGVEVLTRHLDKLIERHGNGEYYFRRGEIYLRFKRYKEARRDFLEGLRKDRKAEQYGLDAVYLALARCYAAEGRYADAERYLRKTGLESFSDLTETYPEFTEMAKDERYGKIFQRE